MIRYGILIFYNWLYGANAVLGDTSLSAGKYTQILLIVEDGSYVVDGGVKNNLIIPSGSQSGIKLNHSFDIEGGNLYEFYLDFNVDKSIIITGNGQYKLKPVIRVIPLLFRVLFQDRFFN